MDSTKANFSGLFRWLLLLNPLPHKAQVITQACVLLGDFWSSIPCQTEHSDKDNILNETLLCFYVSHPVSVWKLFRGEMRQPRAQVLHPLQEKTLYLSLNGQKK